MRFEVLYLQNKWITEKELFHDHCMHCYVLVYYTLDAEIPETVKVNILIKLIIY